MAAFILYWAIAASVVPAKFWRRPDVSLSLSLSRLFGLYRKGMTIERRGVREVRGATSWQRSILRWGDAAASRSDAICVWIFMNRRKAIMSVLNILPRTWFSNRGWFILLLYIARILINNGENLCIKRNAFVAIFHTSLELILIYCIYIYCYKADFNLVHHIN